MAQQLSKWSHRHNQSAYSPKWKKVPRCIEGTIMGTKTALRHSWHYVNQAIPTTVNHTVMWSIWLKLCQYRQHRTSNTHRTELIQNFLMVDPIKGCAGINLYDPSLLPTLQCISKVHHRYPDLSDKQLGGWKHTTAFHKSSEAIRHQEFKHLRVPGVLNHGGISPVGGNGRAPWGEWKSRKK